LEKHKAPRGFGSHCPNLPDGAAQQMLEAAVPELGDVGGRSLYYVDAGDNC